MRLAVTADGQALIKSKIVPTPQDFDQAIQTFKQTADELTQGEKVSGVAGGAAIILDPDKTKAVRSTHLKSWINKPLKAELEKIFAAPAYIENDSHIAGLGEATNGAGANNNIVAFFNIGTGIGGIRIVNGKMDQGYINFEPGHQIIVADGAPCDCGGFGHFESYVGGSGIEKIYHQKGENISDPAIWDEISRHLAMALNNTIVHWAPDIVVLGGAVVKSIPIDNAKQHLATLLKAVVSIPNIVPAKLGNEAGLYGALELLKR